MRCRLLAIDIDGTLLRDDGSLAPEDLEAVVRAPGGDKGTAPSELAATLGVDRAEVAAVGDWFNDVPMLAWAERSLAMGQAPEAVAQAAKGRLKASSRQGGGIAELMAGLLGAS